MTVTSVLAAAARAGLPLTSTQEQLDESGLDYQVVHARDAAGVAWIVRAPRRADVVAASEAEENVLRLVAPRLPVRVPEWRVRTPEVIAYARLAGEPAMTYGAEGVAWHGIDPAAPAAPFVATFAAALAALQAISVDDARAAGVRVRTLDDVRAELGKGMDDTRAELAPSDAVWARWQRWLHDEDLIWPSHVAMTHGDLHPGHMLLDDDGRVTGLLDWTEGAVADPGVDFSVYVQAFGAPALDPLIGAFAAAGGRTWPGLARHATERCAAFPAAAAAWAMRTGNEQAMAFARSLLAAL